MADEQAVRPGSVADAARIPEGFLDRRHAQYQKMLPRWNYVRDHYDDQRIYDDLDSYLPQKRQAEAAEEYEERKSLAHFPNLLGPTLDSFTGLLFHKDDEAEREWGEMGDPEDPASLAGALREDADGTGTDHEAALKDLSTRLLEYQKLGLLVDTNKRPEDDGITRDEAVERGLRPRWRIVDPQAILDWLEDENGRVVEVLVMETADTRTSLASTSGKADEERYLWLGLEGWTRLEKDGEADNGISIVDEGTYEYRDGSGRPTLPLFIAELPLRRYPAHTLARSNNAIFNTMSELRWLLRKIGLGSRFVYSGSSSDFDKFLEESARGAIAILESTSGEENGKGHRWVSPSYEAASAMQGLKQELVTDFWRQALYEFSDRAAERTATEITADFVASIGAFLNILAGAVDEAENAVLRLLEQAAGIGDGAFVKRTRSFGVADGISAAQRLKTVLFGDMGEMPLTPTLKAKAVARIAALMDLADRDDLETVEDELQRQAEIEADRQTLIDESLRRAGTLEDEPAADARVKLPAMGE